MDRENSMSGQKYMSWDQRMDSGFESHQSSINPSNVESGFSASSLCNEDTDIITRNASNDIKKSIDQEINELERATSGISLSIGPVHDPEFEMVYTYWLVVNEQGKIPFHQAIINGEIDVVHSIAARCQHKHLLNIPNSTGHTPLSLAVMSQQADIARILVIYGADLAKLSNGNTPLHLACKLGDSVMVDMLTTPINEQFLVENPFLEQVNISDEYINKTNYQGMTALHIAVKNGFLNIARILIKELGCDVNDEDRVSGNTCLHVLMESEGSLDMLRYLLKHDADPNITNFSGHTALHLAASHCLRDAVDVLLCFTTADLSALTPEEDLAEDLAHLDSTLVHHLKREMNVRLQAAAR